jgi:hypothetical protein
MNMYTQGQQATDGLINVEGITGMVTPASLDIGCVLPDIDDDQINAWQNGLIECALYYDDKVPFFVLGFNGLPFTWALNFKKLTPWGLLQWLTRQQTHVNLVLIERNDFLIKATYDICLKHTSSLKKILAAQYFMSRTSVFKHAAKLQQQLSTETMSMGAKTIWLRR